MLEKITVSRAEIKLALKRVSNLERKKDYT